MQSLTQFPQSLVGRIQVPGDKSISHRALILGAVAKGQTTIDHLLIAEDTLTTLNALQSLGIQITQKATQTRVNGQGGFQFTPNQTKLQMNNAGTATRLLIGLLAQQSVDIDLIGDQSLSQRPMQRVMAPLMQMGANFKTTSQYLPVSIGANSRLKPLNYQIPVASAQVKSALMLAAFKPMELVS